MRRDEIDRLHSIKDYLDGWDWSVVPWYEISEKDARVLKKVIDMYFNSRNTKRLEAQRRIERRRNDQEQK